MRLQQLIDEVEAQTDGDDALERLRAAVAVQRQVTALGDELVDHYVAAARAGGRSWAQVGEALGVTRQAAQQRQAGLVVRLGRAARRSTRGWMGRFSREAREAVVQAQVAARSLGDGSVGSGHLLLGVLAVEGSLGAWALTEHGVDHAAVEREVRAWPDRGPRATRPGRHLPFTPGAKGALEQALREAQGLGHRHIGTEHVVLGLLETGDETTDLLVTRGVSYPRLRAWVAEHTDGAGGDEGGT